MTETDRFHEVERRAQSARAALDAAVADTAIPDVPAQRRPSGRRHQTYVVAAAAVIAVALAGAALLASGDDDQSTVAGQPEITYLVLPEPQDLGFELTAAFDGSQPAPSGSSGEDVAMTVQAPADADEPWASSVIEYSLPADASTLAGEAVDIGGPEATVSTSGVAPTVSWVDGDRARLLLSQHLSTDELVVLARQVVATGTTSGSPLPGHTVLFTGTAFDVLPLLATSTGPPSGVAGVAYSGQDSDAGFALTMAPGDEARWQATYAAAERIQRTTVRGHDAVIADFAIGVTEISWLEADGTLVRADTVRAADLTLPAVLERLTEIDADAFATLVEAHPVPDDRSETPSGGQGAAPVAGEGPHGTSGQSVAAVELEEAGTTYRAALLVDDAGAATLETSRHDADVSSSSASLVDSLETSTAVRDVLDSGRGVMVAGIIGPDVSRVDVIDPTTGTVIGGSGPSTATIDGSDHVLFMGVFDDEWSGRDLVVVGVAADGTTVEIAI